MVRMRKLFVVALALGLGACSSGSHQPAVRQPEVATLASPAASSPSPSATPERPRARLDGTDKDFQALAEPYGKCMAAHGQAQSGQKGWAEGSGLPPALVAAQKACENLWPLPPWELDPSNPEARNFARAVVKCLRDKGVAHVETGKDGLGVEAGGDDNDSRSISLTGKYLLPCQRQVAARQ
jgi:hypothetical protein